MRTLVRTDVFVWSCNVDGLLGFFKSIYSVLCNMFCINRGNKFLASEHISLCCRNEPGTELSVKQSKMNSVTYCYDEVHLKGQKDADSQR